MTTENNTDENLDNNDAVRQMATTIKDVSIMKEDIARLVVAAKAADRAEFDSMANPDYLRGSMEMIAQNLTENIELWEKHDSVLEPSSITIPFNDRLSTSIYYLEAFFEMAAKADWEESRKKLSVLSLGVILLEDLYKKLCNQIPEQYVQEDQL